MQISQAKETLVSGKSQMEDARAKIRAKQQELDEAKKTYQNGLQQLEQGKKQYEQGKAAYDSRYAEASGTDSRQENRVGVYRTELDQGWDGLSDTSERTIEALKAQALEELAAVTSLDALKDLRVKYLAKRPDDRNPARHGQAACRRASENRPDC